MLLSVEDDGSTSVARLLECKLSWWRRQFASRENCLPHVGQVNMVMRTLGHLARSDELRYLLRIYTVLAGSRDWAAKQVRQVLQLYTWTSKFTRYDIEQYFQAELVIYQRVGMVAHAALE